MYAHCILSSRAWNYLVALLRHDDAIERSVLYVTGDNQCTIKIGYPMHWLWLTLPARTGNHMHGSFTINPKYLPLMTEPVWLEQHDDLRSNIPAWAQADTDCLTSHPRTGGEVTGPMQYHTTEMMQPLFQQLLDVLPAKPDFGGEVTAQVMTQGSGTLAMVGIGPHGLVRHYLPHTQSLPMTTFHLPHHAIAQLLVAQQHELGPTSYGIHTGSNDGIYDQNDMGFWRCGAVTISTPLYWKNFPNFGVIHTGSHVAWGKVPVPALQQLLKGLKTVTITLNNDQLICQHDDRTDVLPCSSNGFATITCDVAVIQRFLKHVTAPTTEWGVSSLGISMLCPDKQTYLAFPDTQRGWSLTY